MATGAQIARVIILIIEDATAQHPNDVEKRSTAFTQMLCGAMAGLDHQDAAAALRTMLGVRTSASTNAIEVH
jgi:hypothetical protein